MYGAGKDNTGRSTDNLSRVWMSHHPDFQCPQPLPYPQFLHGIPFMLQPSQLILAWDRHQIMLPYLWLCDLSLSINCKILLSYPGELPSINHNLSQNKCAATVLCELIRLQAITIRAITTPCKPHSPISNGNITQLVI